MRQLKTMGPQNVVALKDRRRHARKLVRIPVVYALGECRYTGVITNLSPGGACILSDKPAPKGYWIGLDFEVIRNEVIDKVEVRAMVVWTEREGFRVAFSTLSPWALESVLHIVHGSN